MLSDTEIGEIWHAAGDAPSPYGTVVRLLILTGQRRGEVAGMTWSELSDDLAIWTLPGERTKNGAAHTVPLSAPARDLHENKQRANGGLLLPGAVGTPFAGWSKAKRALDKAIRDTRAKGAAITGTSPARLVPWNVHDLRRTVAFCRRLLRSSAAPYFVGITLVMIVGVIFHMRLLAQANRVGLIGDETFRRLGSA